MHCCRAPSFRLPSNQNGRNSSLLWCVIIHHCMCIREAARKRLSFYEDHMSMVMSGQGKAQGQARLLPPASSQSLSTPASDRAFTTPAVPVSTAGQPVFRSSVTHRSQPPFGPFITPQSTSQPAAKGSSLTYAPSSATQLPYAAALSQTSNSSSLLNLVTGPKQNTVTRDWGVKPSSAGAPPPASFGSGKFSNAGSGSFGSGAISSGGGSFGSGVFSDGPVNHSSNFNIPNNGSSAHMSSYENGNYATPSSTTNFGSGSYPTAEYANEEGIGGTVLMTQSTPERMTKFKEASFQSPSQNSQWASYEFPWTQTIYDENQKVRPKLV